MKLLRPNRFQVAVHAVAALAVVCLLCVVQTVRAEETNGNSAVSQSFRITDSDAVQGVLVSTKGSDPATVELATTNSASRLTGVLSKTALVQLSNSKAQQVQIVLNGTTPALVSDINGTIKAGDKVTASPLNGVGMRATSDTQIIGIAQSDQNLASSTAKTVKDKSGKSHSVRVGYVSLQVNVSYYIAPTNQFIPSFLQSLANNIAGRPVSAMRIVLGGVLLLLAFGSIFVLIYTSVRSGIISLGRNPLAARAIQKGLLGVIVIVLLVAAVSLIGVYLTLTV